MPQLNFLDQSEGNRFSIDYWSNPLLPEDHCHFSITVADHVGNIKNVLYCKVPLEVIHELPLETGRACWEAWLFGDWVDVKDAFRGVTKVWKNEARARRRAAELGGPSQLYG